ncbi:MAG: hypothetical protein H7061_04210 [Bdellovibrionaceae bacterium]|nr:hypothetical protein [Bdellovibrio sp.]
MRITKFIPFLFSMLIATSACAPVAKSGSDFSTIASTEKLGSFPNDPLDPAGGHTPSTNQIFCSALSLANIKWPTAIGAGSWSSYFALALNLTGSYEGHQGWQNIGNNLDNQGLSLGLMQQNLGQGTLQPLLIQLFQQDHASLLKNFSNADYSSLRRMLEDWQNEPILVKPLSAQRALASEELFPDSGSFNSVDGIDSDLFKKAATTQSIKPSVQWAINNLYSNKNFIPRWKKSLQDTAMSAAYRTIQVESATKMFVKAKDYVNFFKFKQLRSILFLYDVVVQNGGFDKDNQRAYANWLLKNPSAPEYNRLLFLRDILVERLIENKSSYANDVHARKTSIILGSGTVHGSTRNYPKEYCYDPIRSL